MQNRTKSTGRKWKTEMWRENKKKLESTFKCSVVKKILLFPKINLSTSKQKYLEATVKTSDGEISKTSCF